VFGQDLDIFSQRIDVGAAAFRRASAERFDRPYVADAGLFSTIACTSAMIFSVSGA
jgi:hypothetical protein